MFLAGNGGVSGKEGSETNEVVDGKGPPGIELAENSLVRFSTRDLCGNIEVNEEVKGRGALGNPVGAVEVGNNKGGKWTFELGLVDNVLNDLVYLGCVGDGGRSFL